MKRTEEDNAITLIALIITIVVLLIIASATISAIKENNIISHVEQAVNKHNERQKEEQEVLSGIDKYFNVPESVDDLQEKYQFSYYSAFRGAIADVNAEAIGINADSNKDNAVAGIYMTPENKITVVLLKDTIESERIPVIKDLTINLGGNVLNFNCVVGIEGISGNTNTIIIDGRLAGSGINNNNEEKALIFQTRTNTFIINGGIYNVNTNTDEARWIVVKEGKAIISNCIINVNSKDGNVYSVIAATDSSVEVNGSSINSTSENGAAVGVYTFPKGKTQIDGSSIKVASDNSLSYGVYNVTESGTKITTTDIFADASECSASTNKIAIGIKNMGILNFYSGTVTGTHSGMSLSNGSKTYVHGGKFTSCCHGGIYFAHGPTGEAYVENATISCTDYNGKYKVEGKLEHKYGGFYVGGGTGEGNNNIKAYLNNCNIYGGNHAFVLRGTSGEQNNSVYISNSTIGDNKIRIDNDTMKLYMGQGCNFYEDNKLPSTVIVTNEVYRK